MTRVAQTTDSSQKGNSPPRNDKASVPRIDKVAVERLVRAQLRHNAASSRSCEFILTPKMMIDKYIASSVGAKLFWIVIECYVVEQNGGQHVMLCK